METWFGYDWWSDWNWPRATRASKYHPSHEPEQGGGLGFRRHWHNPTRASHEQPKKNKKISDASRRKNRRQ